MKDNRKKSFNEKQKKINMLVASLLKKSLTPNAAAKHSIRIAMDGVGKFPIFILPTIHNCFEKKIIPENCIDAIASWYVFMLKINDKKLNFEYYEPSWEWIKNYLEKDKVIKFANCEELWGETPKQFPLFSEILEEKINFLKNIY